MTTSELGPITQPVAVLQTREIIQGQQDLVQWEHLGETEVTCENYVNILHQYPNFNFEDKVDFKEEGIVRKLPAMTKRR